MRKLITIVTSFVFTVLLSANVFAAGDEENLQLLGSFKRTDAAMGESIPQDTKFADNVRKNIISKKRKGKEEGSRESWLCSRYM